MQTKAINLWQYLQSYLEDEYRNETGMSPYVDGFDNIPSLEYVKHVVVNNADVIGEVSPVEVEEWYEREVKPMLEPKKAPEIIDLIPRVINVYFIREYKFFFNKNNKKSPVDYVLNVDRIISEKTQNTPPIVFNNVQSFMLNYEIKKMLDKAVTIVNEKYDNIIYINCRMSSDGVLNIIGHLEKTYPKHSFNYVLLDRDNEFADVKDRCNKVHITKTLF